MAFHRQNNGGSSTCVIELQHELPFEEASARESSAPSIRTTCSHGNVRDTNESLPSPTTATERLQQWNHPRINVFRCSATFLTFVIMGLLDASYGVGSS